MKRGRAMALGLLAGTALGSGVVALGGQAADSPSVPQREPRPTAPLPAAAAGALDIPAPRPLGDEPDLSRWAVLRRPVTVRATPARAARAVARVARLTPEGTETPLPVTGRRTGADGRLWIRVDAPVLPNGTRGWVPRRALGAYHVTHQRLVIDLAAQRLTLLDRGKPVVRAAIGVGQSRWPTPRGRFLVRNRLERYSSPQYGPVAFGTSARSPVLTDWPAGGYVGIHGTDRPDLLPGRVSHGCIRLRNREILGLAAVMKVGTPVTIK